MAVDALELRPRTAIGLFDAAVRVCATRPGMWSLTLPAGAALTAAVFWLVDSAQRDEALGLPVAAMTLAWIFRALAQGATCHWLEGELLSSTPAPIEQSLKAALAHLPSLVIASVVSGAINLAVFFLSAGLGWILLSAHLVAYAVAMKSLGSPLAIYATSSRLLGPARPLAFMVRLCGLSQLLLIINLHAAVNLLLEVVAQMLLGLEVTWLVRFCSVDNPTWVATVVALGFSLFEPLRAACATLLLIDGRVRAEGLDLIAQLEQLPRRKGTAAAAAAALALLLALAPSLAQAQGAGDARRAPAAARRKPPAPPAATKGAGATRPADHHAPRRAAVDPAPPAAPAPPAPVEADAQPSRANDTPADAQPAHANDTSADAQPAPAHETPAAQAARGPQPPAAADDWRGVFTPGVPESAEVESSSSTSERFGALVDDCALQDKLTVDDRAQLDALARSQPQAALRLVRSLEALAYDAEDCEGALEAFERSRALLARPESSGQSPSALRAQAQEILSGSEFRASPTAPPKPKEEERDKAPPSWLQRLVERLTEWLRELLRARPEPAERSASLPSSSLGMGNVVLFGGVLLVVAILAYVLLQGRAARSVPTNALEVSALPAAAEGELGALARAPEGWAELADAHAARGEFRLAIRTLYLALLSRLHRDGAIDYDPNKSNWDYFRHFQGPREALPPFRELTRRFDFAWYGHQESDGAAWVAFRALTAPLLAPQAEGRLSA